MMINDSATTPLDFDTIGIVYSIDDSTESTRQYFVDDGGSIVWVIISEENR